jgi:predicted small lipoprotein YifL
VKKYIALAFITLLGATACGQTGPLYRPQEMPKTLPTDVQEESPQKQLGAKPKNSTS